MSFPETDLRSGVSVDSAGLQSAIETKKIEHGDQHSDKKIEAFSKFARMCGYHIAEYYM